MLFKYLKNHQGDENVSKIIWVIIIFIVGALLLLLLATSFSDTVASWYNQIIESRFGVTNGSHEIPDTNGGNESPQEYPGVIVPKGTPLDGMNCNDDEMADRITAGTPQNGDTFDFGDYIYTYSNEQ